MPYRDHIIPQVPATTAPAILRSRLHHRIIRQVNSNTAAIGPPRSVRADEDIAGQKTTEQYQREQERPNRQEGAIDDTPPSIEQVTLSEVRRSTSVVRVTNPDDEEQFVDVARIDSVLMIGSDGRTYELQFVNGSA